MKITVTGTGYVGLVTGTCLAEMGNQVVCLDADPAKVRVLDEGGVPISEPGLTEMVRRNRRAGRLSFTTDAAAAVRHGSFQFIAVGTPPDEDGSADVSHVLAAAREIGRHMTEYTVVVDKSTVPVGTAERVRDIITDELARRGVALGFAVVANPEFLKEGSAVQDFMRPDRVIVGADDDHAVRLLRALYAPFVRNHDRMLVMDVRSAEFAKYAANAMLATRISFMNELALLAEKVGADIEWVRRGIGSDPRIGYDFLYAGAGYGGSCFPKDVQALIRAADDAGVSLDVLRAVRMANERQKRVLVDKVVARFGDDLTGRRFGLWGLAFKPNTEDMREAPSRVVVRGLVERGAAVCAYDPLAIAEARRCLGDVDVLRYADSPLAALEDADALLIVTEWKEFKSPDFDGVRKALKQPVIFDGRNLYDPATMQALGIEYHAIGRGRP